MTERPIVSICVPVYYSGTETARVLEKLLVSIREQDYPQHRLDICLSLQRSEIKNSQSLAYLHDKYGCYTIYPLADVDGPAKNTNSALSLACDEDYIKIMNQDDFLDSPTAISEMVAELEGSDARWLVNACIHTDSDGTVRERPHYPYWPGEKGMVEGVNRFGCPSVVMFEASGKPRCDPGLILCMDCDLWIQLYRTLGAPILRNVPDVVIRMWDDQLSNQLDYGKSLEIDKIYMRSKYGYA